MNTKTNGKKRIPFLSKRKTTKSENNTSADASSLPGVLSNMKISQDKGKKLSKASKSEEKEKVTPFDKVIFKSKWLHLCSG